MIPLDSIKPNPDNPRTIGEDELQELMHSIRTFPKMMTIRGFVLDNPDNMTVVGGNQRLLACERLGMAEVPDNWVQYATDFTEDELAEFVVRDNIPFGRWDWGKINSSWSHLPLREWGLQAHAPTAINAEEFFNTNHADTPKLKKITLEYTDEDYEKVEKAFGMHTGTREEIVFALLGC